MVQATTPEAFTLIFGDDTKKPNTDKRVESLPEMADTKHLNFFKERKVDNTTTDCQTLTHLMKSTLGTGILSMPYAFKASGVVGGVLGGLLMAVVCTHTCYILIDCAHILYAKARKNKMEYAEVVATAFATGPDWSRKYAKLAEKCVLVWLFLSYFGACVADNIVIANNYGQVIRYYMNSGIGNITEGFNETTAAALATAPVEYSLLRAILGCLVVPLILLFWVPDLKYLAPVSTIANIFMAAVIAITCYYLVQDPKPMDQLYLFQTVTEAPQFFSITLFAMENIGVIMPLENNMKTPRNFLGTCGVLNRGMFSITFVYILLGALGYLKYGDEVNPIITTNLPVTDVAAQIVKILIGSTVLLTFSLQFYVCREMVWSRVEKYFPNRPRLAEYTIRALLVISCVSIAIMIPMIGPLVTLVGAFGFSLLGIIVPVVIELIVYRDIGYGRYNWMVYKNFLFILFGISSLIFGTHYAIQEIVTEKLFTR